MSDLSSACDAVLAVPACTPAKVPFDGKCNSLDSPTHCSFDQSRKSSFDASVQHPFLPLNPEVIAICVPTSPSFRESFPYAFQSCNVVYTAFPVEDPNAYKDAIVISPGYKTKREQSIALKPNKLNTIQCLNMFACANDCCDFECNHMNEMREHTRLHPNFRHYRCLFPGCTFVSSNLKDINYHRGYHTGERPYRCSHPDCEFAAPNASQLRLHMISHSDAKPFKCSFENCMYSTRYKSALVNHERTHTGEKPYRCKICKTFYAKQKSGLQYHIKTVHMSK